MGWVFMTPLTLFAAAYSVAMVASGLANSSHKMHHYYCPRAGKSPQTLENTVYIYSQIGSINAGLSVSMSVNKGAEGRWLGRSRWHIPVSSAQSFWYDLQHMSGQSPGRPNRITKGRLRSHQCTPVLALMCKRTMGQSMLLNQTVQGRIYCLIIAENLIIYSAKYYMRQTGEKADTGRGRTWKDKRVEGGMERGRGEMERKENEKRQIKAEISEEMYDRPLLFDCKQTSALPAD